MDVYREFLKEFCSERLLYFLESFVPYEFTVLPSLKCLGRTSFRLPLTNSYSSAKLAKAKGTIWQVKADDGCNTLESLLLPTDTPASGLTLGEHTHSRLL